MSFKCKGKREGWDPNHMIPHVLKCASCAHCSGINVEITLRKWDMAWDKTSSSGRLAWRGPHSVIAHFTHPIHFHSSLSALLHGKKGSFPFLNHIFPEIQQTRNYIFFPTDLMNEPQIHGRTFFLWLRNCGCLWPFPIFSHPFLYLCPPPLCPR